MIARIENGVVVQVAVCNNVDFANERYGGHWVLLSENDNVGIGCLYDGEKFINPEPETPEVTDEEII